jgi:RecA DNA recombination protein
MANTAAGILSTLVRKGASPVDSSSFLALDHLSPFLRLPRGAISEILGRPSSGRTALLHAMLAESLSRGEICAYIDCADSFDPATARNNGVALERLLWVRCGQKPDRALKAADWILHGGGFGVVILDLCDALPETLRRIPLPWWYRFRRAVESTPSILAIAGTQSIAGSCASCVIEMERRGIRWSGSAQVPVLDGIDFRAASRKPVRAAAPLRAILTERAVLAG